MNNKRRKDLAKADKLLQEAFEIVEKIRNEEEEAKDNTPESFSDRIDEMESCIYDLDEALENIENAQMSLGEYMPSEPTINEEKEIEYLKEKAKELITILNQEDDEKLKKKELLEKAKVAIEKAKLKHHVAKK